MFYLQEIASEVQSESKWKQLGELAMSTGNVCYLFIWILLILYIIIALHIYGEQLCLFSS